jgi:hypothetical protein
MNHTTNLQIVDAGWEKEKRESQILEELLAQLNHLYNRVSDAETAVEQARQSINELREHALVELPDHNPLIRALFPDRDDALTRILTAHLALLDALLADGKEAFVDPPLLARNAIAGHDLADVLALNAHLIRAALSGRTLGLIDQKARIEHLLTVYRQTQIKHTGE